MNILQAVVVVLSLGFSSSCGHADRERSNNHEGLDHCESLNSSGSSDCKYEAPSVPDDDGVQGKPNGLSNNRFRCYANASLQLLAACFSKEIKGIRPFQDTEVEKIRRNLCKVIDHINATETRDSSNQEVLDAVTAITDSLDTHSPGEGGSVREFIEALDNRLHFLPSYKLHRGRFSFLSKESDTSREVEDMTWEDAGKTDTLMMREAFTLTMVTSVVDEKTFDLGLQGGVRILDDSEFERFRTVLTSDLSAWTDVFGDVVRKIRQSLNDKRVSLRHVLEFARLGEKLPSKSKILLFMEDYSQFPEWKFDAGINLPYSPNCEDLSWTMQRFDVIGFVVSGDWHFIAYMKRKGTWYEINDSRVSDVDEAKKRQLLADWSIKSGNKKRKGRAVSIIAVCEARS